MCGKEIVGSAVDGNALDGVVLADAIDHVLTLSGFAKDGVLAIKVRSGTMGDEELGAVRVWARIGHGEDTRLVVATVGLALTLELVAGATSASSSGAASLNHEVGDHPMKSETIIEPAGGEMQKGSNRDGCVVGEGGDFDIAFAGVNGDLNVVHEGGESRESRPESPD